MRPLARTLETPKQEALGCPGALQTPLLRDLEKLLEVPYLGALSNHVAKLHPSGLGVNLPKHFAGNRIKCPDLHIKLVCQPPPHA